MPQQRQDAPAAGQSRSGSSREFKKFSHDLRQLIAANDLPGYLLAEEKGADGPILVMHNRDHAGRLLDA